MKEIKTISELEQVVNRSNVSAKITIEVENMESNEYFDLLRYLNHLSTTSNSLIYNTSEVSVSTIEKIYKGNK